MSICSSSTYFNKSQSFQAINVFDAAKVSFLRQPYSPYRSGFVIALADGCGHPKDEGMVAALKSHSRVSIEMADELLSHPRFTNPQELKESLEKFEVIGAIKQYFERIRFNTEYTETACLAAGRGYSIDHSSIRFVGFNIGDCMVISYDPITKVTRTISSARAPSENKNNPQQIGYVIKDRPHEFDLFDITLPNTSIVFIISDGVWEALNTIECINNDISISSIRDLGFLSRLHLTAPVEQYTTLITQYVLDKSEQTYHSPKTEYGDDASIAAVQLKPAVQQNQRLPFPHSAVGSAPWLTPGGGGADWNF